MADAIKNPIFAKEEFDKEQDKLIEGLRSQERSVTDVSNRIRPALIFGKDHPKGEFTTIEKVEKITLNDVKNFYDNFFNPRNAYLVVVGDVKRADVERMVREHLSDWEAKAVPSVKYTDPQDVQYTQINFVDMRSEEHTSESSHVRISYAVFCLKK